MMQPDATFDSTEGRWWCNLMLRLTARKGVVGWDINVLTTTSLILRCQHMLITCGSIFIVLYVDHMLKYLHSTLLKWLPKQLNVKKSSKGHSVVNPHLKEKTFQWLWRCHKNVNDKFTPAQMCKEMGKLCKRLAWIWKMTLTLPPTGHPARRDLGSLIR